MRTTRFNILFTLTLTTRLKTQPRNNALEHPPEADTVDAIILSVDFDADSLPFSFFIDDNVS